GQQGDARESGQEPHEALRGLPSRPQRVHRGAGERAERWVRGPACHVRASPRWPGDGPDRRIGAGKDGDPPPRPLALRSLRPPGGRCPPSAGSGGPCASALAAPRPPPPPPPPP